MSEVVNIGERVEMPGVMTPVQEARFKAMKRAFSTEWESVEIDPSEYQDPTEPFVPIDFAITVNGVPVFAFDDYNYMSGQAGNGKSFTMLIYEAVILGCSFGDVKYTGSRKKPRILHIDTEQSKGNVQLHKTRLYHMVGWEQLSDHRDQYQILQLRDTPSAKLRWAKVIKAAFDLCPDFVIVDGMLDTVTSMNDEEECSRVISEAGALASILGLCEIGICHENPRNPKASEEGPDKPAGHIGSFSQRKAAAGQSTQKKLENKKATFHVQPKKVRNDDYDGFWFGINKEDVKIGDKVYKIAIPYWIGSDGNDTPSTTQEDPMASYNESVKEAMMSIEWSVEGNRYTEIEKGLKSLGITSKRKLSDYITVAQQIGVVSKNEATKKYFLVYQDGAKMDTQTSIDNNSVGDESEDTVPF